MRAEKEEVERYGLQPEPEPEPEPELLLLSTTLDSATTGSTCDRLPLLQQPICAHSAKKRSPKSFEPGAAAENEDAGCRPYGSAPVCWPLPR